MDDRRERASKVHRETNGRENLKLHGQRIQSVAGGAQSTQSALGDRWGTSGDKWETIKSKTMRAKHSARTSCRKASPETNGKSCWPRLHPFQRSEIPSQVNPEGEKSLQKKRCRRSALATVRTGRPGPL